MVKYHRMNRAGRISIVGLLGLLGIIVFIAVLVSGRESLSSVGARFMGALAKGDVDELTKLSYLGTESQEDVRKQWEFACHTAGRYYNFTYQITSSLQADPTSGSVRMQVTKNATDPGSYAEGFQLPLVKVGDEWKVDVKGISREMYPALPR